jgi:hypothetical protein
MGVLVSSSQQIRIISNESLLAKQFREYSPFIQLAYFSKSDTDIFVLLRMLACSEGSASSKHSISCSIDVIGVIIIKFLAESK